VKYQDPNSVATKIAAKVSRSYRWLMKNTSIVVSLLVAVQSRQPIVSAASKNKYIDKILNPVMHITLELHELSGDSSVVPELTELEGNVVMPHSIEKVRSDSHEILVAAELGTWLCMSML
jgi:hypothetical protein